MFKEHIVRKANDGACYNYEEENPDEFIAFYDSHPCTKGSANCITNSHWDGNSKKNSSTAKEKNDGAKVGSHVYQFGIGTGL